MKKNGSYYQYHVGRHLRNTNPELFEKLKAEVVALERQQSNQEETKETPKQATKKITKTTDEPTEGELSVLEKLRNRYKEAA